MRWALQDQNMECLNFSEDDEIDFKDESFPNTRDEVLYHISKDCVTEDCHKV